MPAELIPLSEPFRAIDNAIDRVARRLHEANDSINVELNLSADVRARLDAKVQAIESRLLADAENWKNELADSEI